MRERNLSGRTLTAVLASLCIKEAGLYQRKRIIELAMVNQSLHDQWRRTLSTKEVSRRAAMYFKEEENKSLLEELATRGLAIGLAKPRKL